jgi:hypothetical protein
MTDDLRFYQSFTWFPVQARLVKVGDLYGNHSTVTAIKHGPTLPLGDAFEDLKDGEVLVRCGESMATKGSSERVLVIGRRIAEYVPNEDDS